MDGRPRDEPHEDWRVWCCAEELNIRENRKLPLLGATGGSAATHRPKTSSISSNVL